MVKSDAVASGWVMFGEVWMFYDKVRWAWVRELFLGGFDENYST